MTNVQELSEGEKRIIDIIAFLMAANRLNPNFPAFTSKEIMIMVFALSYSLSPSVHYKDMRNYISAIENENFPIRGTYEQKFIEIVKSKPHDTSNTND